MGVAVYPARMHCARASSKQFPGFAQPTLEMAHQVAFVQGGHQQSPHEEDAPELVSKY